MPRPRRTDFAGAWHHVMNRGLARSAIFTDDQDKRVFLEELADAAAYAALEVHAYCLMGNHYHLLLRSAEGRLSQGMQRLSSRFTHRANRRFGRDGPLFRGRFTSVGIDTDAHLMQTVRYIHLNPVAAGLVKKPDDWKWSSASAYLDPSKGDVQRGLNRGQTHGSDPILRVHVDFILSMFGGNAASAYRDFMAAGVDEQTRKFYDALQTGSDPWV